MATERRRHPRFPSGANIHVVAEVPEGKDVWCEGACLNISEAGILIKTPQQLPVGTVVSFRIEKWDLQGWATVRHCREENKQFLTGLEFNQGLRWVPQFSETKAPRPSLLPLLLLLLIAAVGVVAVVVSTMFG